MAKIPIIRTAGVEGLQGPQGGGGSGESLKSSYTQTAHGFSAGDVVSFYNNTWYLADADDGDKLGRWIVETVTDVNTFEAVFSGLITVDSWNLTPGKYYMVGNSGALVEYVDADTPNFLFDNPILQALTSTTGHVLPWRGNASTIEIPAGDQGPQGWQGTSNVGVQGPQGWQGQDGTVGVDGTQGPQGWQGQDGTVGVDGTQGPQGWQGPTLDVTNNTDNYILTATGGNSVNGESGLTFNGSTLAVTGAITATGDITGFYTSDRRLKSNIRNIDFASAKINRINGVNFDWIEKEGVHNNSGGDVGVIAQEVREVLPEAVIERDNGYLAVNYERIIPLLIESNKEMQSQIYELQRQIAILKNKINL